MICPRCGIELPSSVSCLHPSYSARQATDDGWECYDAERDGAPVPAPPPITLRRWDTEQASIRRITTAARKRWPNLWALEEAGELI